MSCIAYGGVAIVMRVGIASRTYGCVVTRIDGESYEIEGGSTLTIANAVWLNVV
jgi:hypothetical protein